ncbi:MAG: bifunctional phosphoglucose/phosphomannose isomerase [Candidatus Taylorbacteria bacterium]|nr:bifunctional phosphoglucose/phosphomannose isomerase [Candidatus Taylorbacteria bacterium]
MIEENILNFNKQFSWEPKIENQKGLTLDLQKGRTLVLGMGGSHLGADILNSYDPELNLAVHSDYGLPKNVSKDDLVIASSYSGNTEEVIDGLNQALKEGLTAAVIASGGKLLEMAKEKGLPYIQLPTGHQPRLSIGFQVKALAKLLGHQTALEEISRLAEKLNPGEFEEKGRELAEKAKGKIPMIYTSQANFALAYNWKIKFNESGKVPAFYNVFPELNHNEMNGFLSQGSTLDLQKGRTFIFLILTDAEDHPRIQKRMTVMTELFRRKNWPVETIGLAGEGRWQRIFSSLLTADWAAYFTAKQLGLDPENIPLVEEFKKLIR